MNQTFDPTTPNETIPDDACKTASLLHLSALLGLLGNGIGFILAPLVVWLLKRDDDPFIDEQGKEAVNFQITMTLAAIVAGVLIVVLIGIVLLPLVLIAMVALPIVAAMRAREGEPYRYPFTIRFVK
jgi:uncharacterized Tic20 family protein